MNQEAFGFSESEPVTTPVSVNMDFLPEPALDDIWLAYMELPYKHIMEFAEDGTPTALGKPLGCIAEKWGGFTSEWACFVMCDGHLHIVWQEGEYMYRCCLGRYKYMLGEDDELPFVLMLDQITDGVPLITSLTIQQRE